MNFISKKGRVFIRLQTIKIVEWRNLRHVKNLTMILVHFLSAG